MITVELLLFLKPSLGWVWCGTGSALRTWKQGLLMHSKPPSFPQDTPTPNQPSALHMKGRSPDPVFCPWFLHPPPSIQHLCDSQTQCFSVCAVADPCQNDFVLHLEILHSAMRQWWKYCGILMYTTVMNNHHMHLWYLLCILSYFKEYCGITSFVVSKNIPNGNTVVFSLWLLAHTASSMSTHTYLTPLPAPAYPPIITITHICAVLLIMFSALCVHLYSSGIRVAPIRNHPTNIKAEAA